MGVGGGGGVFRVTIFLRGGVGGAVFLGVYVWVGGGVSRGTIFSGGSFRGQSSGGAVFQGCGGQFSWYRLTGSAGSASYFGSVCFGFDSQPSHT